MAAQTRAGSYAWAALSLAAAALTVLSLPVSVLRLVTGDLTVLVRGPASLLFGYWIAMGAWRRTSWGRPEPEAEVVGPPVLTAVRATQMTFIAGGCIAAVAVALAWQILAARS